VSEYVTTQPRTICRKCRHMMSIVEHKWNYDGCHAARETRWSAITGHSWVWVPRCSTVNDGNCSSYEAKE